MLLDWWVTWVSGSPAVGFVCALLETRAALVALSVWTLLSAILGLRAGRTAIGAERALVALALGSLVAAAAVALDPLLAPVVDVLQLGFESALLYGAFRGARRADVRSDAGTSCLKEAPAASESTVASEGGLDAPRRQASFLVAAAPWAGGYARVLAPQLAMKATFVLAFHYLEELSVLAYMYVALCVGVCAYSAHTLRARMAPAPAEPGLGPLADPLGPTVDVPIHAPEPPADALNMVALLLFCSTWQAFYARLLLFPLAQAPRVAAALACVDLPFLGAFCLTRARRARTCACAGGACGDCLERGALADAPRPEPRPEPRRRAYVETAVSTEPAELHTFDPWGHGRATAHDDVYAPVSVAPYERTAPTPVVAPVSERLLRNASGLAAAFNACGNGEPERPSAPMLEAHPGQTPIVEVHPGSVPRTEPHPGRAPVVETRTEQSQISEQNSIALKLPQFDYPPVRAVHVDVERPAGEVPLARHPLALRAELHGIDSRVVGEGTAAGAQEISAQTSFERLDGTPNADPLGPTRVGPGAPALSVDAGSDVDSPMAAVPKMDIAGMLSGSSRFERRNLLMAPEGTGPDSAASVLSPRDKPLGASAEPVQPPLIAVPKLALNPITN